jgi:LmbE family N-acetylglucosaminyl deacetylase
MSANDVARLGTILSIWAHPDDETYLAGGLMAAAAQNGQRVVCVSATAGELGTDDATRWPPERLGRLRRWECRAAMSVLGIDDHRWLDYPDGGLADIDPGEPVRRIQTIVADVRPDTILTFGPDGGTFHPDHQTVSRWVDAAVDPGHQTRVLHAALAQDHLDAWGDHYEAWGIYLTDERPVAVPDHELAVRLRLRGAALDQKIAALCAMYSQVAPAVALLGEDDFRATNVDECFVDRSR